MKNDKGESMSGDRQYCENSAAVGKAAVNPSKTELRGEMRGGPAMIVLRREIGDVLRDTRRDQGRTLREVSAAARVSLGYLSEVERGQKEASSELLASICSALEVPMSLILRRVSDRVALAEGVMFPDTVPAELLSGVDDLMPVG